MNIPPELSEAINSRIAHANRRYGEFASTHEALGVALEEWDELRHAVQKNELYAVEKECVDLAAVLIRLADQLLRCNYVHERSVK